MLCLKFHDLNLVKISIFQYKVHLTDLPVAVTLSSSLFISLPLSSSLFLSLPLSSNLFLSLPLSVLVSSSFLVSLPLSSSIFLCCHLPSSLFLSLPQTSSLFFSLTLNGPLFYLTIFGFHYWVWTIYKISTANIALIVMNSWNWRYSLISRILSTYIWFIY